MVLDSSAIVAILVGEPEKQSFLHAIDADPVRLISTVTMVETAIVIEAKKDFDGGRDVDDFFERIGAKFIPVDQEQAKIARVAYRQFGKRKHPAALNFGDCFSYALAYATGEPLLFKGDDFSRTDILVV